MQRVQTGHGEVEREKQLRMALRRSRNAFQKEAGLARDVVLDKLLMPLKGLDAKEGATQNQRQNQKQNERLPLSQLRSANGQHHRKAAAQQHHRIEGSNINVEACTGHREDFGIAGAI